MSPESKCGQESDHITWLELGPQQKNTFLAWFVENKGSPKKSNKSKRGANSGEDLNQKKKTRPWIDKIHFDWWLIPVFMGRHPSQLPGFRGFCPSTCTVQAACDVAHLGSASNSSHEGCKKRVNIGLSMGQIRRLAFWARSWPSCWFPIEPT